MTFKQRTRPMILLAWLAPFGCGVAELPRSLPTTPDPGAPAASTGTGGSTGGSTAPAGSSGGAMGSAGGAPGNRDGGSRGSGGTAAGGAGATPADAGAGTSPGATGGAGGGTPTPDPPASGPGITIAGRFVPKQQAIVVLHIGHSNMAGRAQGPEALKPHFYDVHPQLWIYGAGAAIRPAQEPTAPDNQEGQAAGPGMALLHAVLTAAPAGAQVLSIGHGHSGSFAGYCSNFRKGGLFYDIVMKPAVELKGKVTFAGIFAMFGQSEHNASVGQQKGLSDCLAGVAADMRADLSEPELPFMLGEYEAGLTKPGIEPTSAFGTAIIAQIKAVPDKTTRAALIPTDGVAMQDDHHYNMAGHKLWAERAIQILLDRGWAPWAKAP
jgi:hypothetical protein